MNTIPDADLRHRPKELVSEQHQKLYMSLLGGLAWTVQTRLDIAVFVAALQRKLKAPTGQDIIDLNRVVRYVQNNPAKLKFDKVKNPWRLIAISESSYQSKEPDCLAMRSGVIVLASKEGLEKGSNNVQLIDFISKKQSRVRRSTYAAELYSALDLIGLAVNINIGLTEVLTGVQTASRLADIMENGKNVIPLDCLIDARSVLDSVSAEEVKTPNDKIMLVHALKLREHLERGQLNRLVWIDTRDMVSDGLNKGSISRDALKLLMMQAVVRLAHDHMVFQTAPKTSHDDMEPDGRDRIKDSSRQPESKCT